MDRHLGLTLGIDRSTRYFFRFNFSSYFTPFFLFNVTNFLRTFTENQTLKHLVTTGAGNGKGYRIPERAGLKRATIEDTDYDGTTTTRSFTVRADAEGSRRREGNWLERPKNTRTVAFLLLYFSHDHYPGMVSFLC